MKTCRYGFGRAKALVVVVLAFVSLGLSACSGAATQASLDEGERSEDEIEPTGESLASTEAESVTSTTAVPVRPEVVIPDEWGSEIEELYGRYWLYWEAFAAAHAPPHADPDHEQLRQLSTPANWESLSQQLTGFQDDGVVLVLPERSITEHLLQLPSTVILEKSEGTEIVLLDCWIDDFVQQSVDGEILSEAREAKLMNVSMKVIDGDWRVNGVTRSPPDTDGFEQCASYAS